VGPSTTKSDRISSADTSDRFEGTGSAEDEEVKDEDDDEEEEHADEKEEADAGDAKHEVTEADEDAEVVEGGELNVAVEAATGFWTRDAVVLAAATTPAFLIPRDRSRSHWNASVHKCASGCEMASRSRVRLGVMSEKQCEGAQKRVPGSKCAGEVASCDVEGP